MVGGIALVNICVCNIGDIFAGCNGRVEQNGVYAFIGAEPFLIRGVAHRPAAGGAHRADGDIVEHLARSILHIRNADTEADLALLGKKHDGIILLHTGGKRAALHIERENAGVRRRGEDDIFLYFIMKNGIIYRDFRVGCKQAGIAYPAGKLCGGEGFGIRNASARRCMGGGFARADYLRRKARLYGRGCAGIGGKCPGKSIPAIGYRNGTVGGIGGSRIGKRNAEPAV